MKRFTETTKWQDQWFRRLPAKLKVFWMFLVDNCDVAGVWNPDLELAAFQIGEEVTLEEVQQHFADRLRVLANGRWFLTKFVRFQYGELNTTNRCHAAVLRSLKDNQVEGAAKDLPRSLEGAKDKDTDKDKVKDREGDARGRGVPPDFAPSASKAVADGQRSADPVEVLWRAHDWVAMQQDEALEVLKQRFPALDVWGEYLRYKTVRSKSGQMPTWRPFLGWLQKASPKMNLEKRKPPKAEPEPDPAGWREFLKSEYPQADPETPYAKAPAEVREEFNSGRAAPA